VSGDPRAKPGAKYVALLPGAYSVPNGAGEAPHLIGSRCRGCGATVFPKMAVCPACRSAETMEEMAMGSSGRLYNFTIARVAPQGFTAPYFQAFVDIPEGPRIFALISRDVPVEEDALQDGMAMELVIEPIGETPEHLPILTYKYRPVGSAGR
jgi:scaffold protein (connect acetoacetyl-CoA thiolase and HMG-CoA synthase)